MSYRFPFFFVLNILWVLAHPQELKLSFSDSFSSVGLESISCIPIEDQIVHVQQKSKDDLCVLTVHVFNAQLKKKASFELNEPRYTFLSVKYFFDEIFVFASLNENNHTYLLYTKFDLQTGFSSFKEIYKEPQKAGYPTTFVFPENSYDSELSILAELPYVKNKNEDIKLLIFDHQMELIKETYNKLEINFEPKRDNKLIVSPKGRVFLIKTHWQKGNNFALYKLGQEIIQEEVVKLNRNKISALDYFFNSKNELVIAGFFTSQIRYNYEGFFLLKYDQDLNMTHKNQNYFSEKIIKTFKSAKDIKESGFGLDKFRLTSFNLDQEGNHYLVAEHLGKKKKKDVSNWYSAGMTIVKFNKNGNYVWGCPIKREQINSSRSFIGSFTLNDFAEPYYFYNALSNLDLKKGIPPNYGTNNYCGTNHITFDEFGVYSTKELSISFPDTQKWAFNPNQLNPIKNQKSIFEITTEAGGKSCLAIIN